MVSVLRVQRSSARSLRLVSVKSLPSIVMASSVRVMMINRAPCSVSSPHKRTASVAAVVWRQPSAVQICLLAFRGGTSSPPIWCVVWLVTRSSSPWPTPFQRVTPRCYATMHGLSPLDAQISRTRSIMYSVSPVSFVVPSMCTPVRLP